MKKVTIIGTGLGLHTMTLEAKEAVQQADVLLGAPRMIEPYKAQPKFSFPYYLPKDVAAFIEEYDAQTFAILVSGDVGFHSAATRLADVLVDYDLHFIPGISTVNAFFAKLKLPWQEAAFISMHGRDMHIVDAVRRNRLTFCLTGNNFKEIGMAMEKAGFDQIKMYVGENLGTENENIYETVAANLIKGDFSPLTVLLFVNETFDDRTLCGIADKNFNRLTGIPMTKSAIRAMIISKLCLRPKDICWDIGAGTGSVTIELALNAYCGQVYAVERRENAIPLIEQNARAFHIGNITTSQAKASEVIETLPIPDAVFIGGSGGELQKIIEVILNKNAQAKIVVTAVTLETVTAVLNLFTKAGLEPDIAQINVSCAKKAGVLHMMEAQNPITILSVNTSDGEK